MDKNGEDVTKQMMSLNLHSIRRFYVVKGFLENLHFTHVEDEVLKIELGGHDECILQMFRASAERKNWTHKNSEYYGVLSFLNNGGVIVTPQFVEMREKDVNRWQENVEHGNDSVRVLSDKPIVGVPIQFEVCELKSSLPEETILFLLADLRRMPFGPQRLGKLRITSIRKSNPFHWFKSKHAKLE